MDNNNILDDELEEEDNVLEDEFTLKDNVKDYDIFGVTVAEVEVDILTGQHQVTRVDILEDAGVSLSPEVDVGQVEGAFVMGLGYYTLENLLYSQQGALLTNRTWNYYPPGPLDIPIDFRIQLRKNSPNPLGVLRSKATGEPPLCMSVAVPLAICQALRLPASRSGPGSFLQAFSTPLSPEKTFLACKNDISFYKYS
ncbi:hypothetical protein J6590_006750 [Homalodisca vitripennis]|nr:hypothetical protein J6590_006750 [Homalodisca vitripennis]